MKSITKISALRIGASLFMSSILLVFVGCTTDEITTEDSNQNLVVEQSQERGSGPSASGHGTLSLEDIPPSGEGFRHFTFHAREKNNGSIHGSGVLTYVGGQLNLKFDIDCLSIDGNTAIMSGVVTQNQQNPAQVGSLCWFAVTDNGEGNNADPDEIALFYTGTDPVVYNCANDFAVPYYEIEGGNIQVRD